MSALQTGLAFTPLSIALFLASLLSARVLVERLGAKAVMVGGILLSTTSMIWLTQISEQSSYTFLLAPLVLLGLGNGLAFVPLTVVALMGVEPEDAGAASGLVNVMQQMGGSLGLAILVTIFGNVTRDPAASQSARDTLASGISTAFIGSAVFAALTLVVIATVVRLPRPVRSEQAPLQDTVELDAHPVSASTVGA
jgi:MFS family permease